MEDTLTERSINVKFRSSNGDAFDMCFDPGQLTVQQLKERLVTQISIPADNMRLVYSGRVLKDEDMVDLYGVKEGHTIHVVRGAANRAAEQAANVTPTTSTQRNVNGTATNPFGINHFGTSLEQDMRNMMNSPVIRQLLSNPEIVRSMVMQNPTMRQMIERNPEIGHIINDPSFIRQTMDMARNPELMREMMRNNDRALANLETIPGGFNHLRRMYHTLQEPLESAGRHNDQSSEAANQRLAQLLNVERPPEGRINNVPLPNPWTPRNSATIANASNPFGSLSGISPYSMMGFPPTQLSFSPSPAASRNAPTTQAPTQSTTGTPSTGTSTTNSSTTGSSNSTTSSNMPAPSFMLPTNTQNISTPNDPEFIRRFQQLMQRYMTSPQLVSSRQQMPQYYPASFFGSPNPFFTSSLSATQTPVSTQPSEPPETRFRTQLQTLEEMGFVDQAANIRALLATGGDVNSAIEFLLAHRS
ncbi:putative Ubiquitin-domain-containing protein [Gigaspora margarita]|uniref:Ubiquilin n=1 Tax=Gigaspora margarita TaxID=4874 RepID=A0A8H4APR7_GIGMA|nr:putative Ubiquitin-domain-containing protein [Gigaspora margarita]